MLEWTYKTQTFTGCHWAVILDPSIGKFRYLMPNLLLIIIVEVSYLMRAINSGTEESALASRALVCTEERRWPWAKLVLVAPAGNQQFKNDEMPCHSCIHSFIFVIQKFQTRLKTQNISTIV